MEYGDSMMGHREMAGSGGLRQIASVWFCVAGIVLLGAQFAPAEQGQTDPDTAATQARPRAPEPGLLHVLGRWFDESLANIGLNDPQGPLGALGAMGARTGEAADGAAGAALGAAEVVIRLPSTRVVTARQRCDPAGNGAPDCQAAANAVCRSKGFWSGRSVDIESAQKCPAQVWLSRRSPDPGECTLETFVTRALCQ
jgi:hypothetical protein